MVKYCKVKIIKERNKDSTHTKFKYPESFEPKSHNFIIYQNEGLECECAVSKVQDNFLFDGKNYIEITKNEAEELIDNIIDNDKDFLSYDKEIYSSLEEAKTHIKQIKKDGL